MKYEWISCRSCIYFFLSTSLPSYSNHYTYTITIPPLNHRICHISCCCKAVCQVCLPLPLFSPASLSHFSSSGFSLHMFLKLRLRASKRDMVVWLKSFPYSLPMARPTSPWRPHNGTQQLVTYRHTDTIHWSRAHTDMHQRTFIVT